MMCVSIRASCVTRGSPAGELDNLSNDDHLKFIKNVRLDALGWYRGGPLRFRDNCV